MVYAKPPFRYFVLVEPELPNRKIRKLEIKKISLRIVADLIE
jgi:hypothetical protein